MIKQEKTPLRKSEIFNRSMAPPQTPINDDEAERRAGREKVLHNDSIISTLSDSLQKDNEGLKNCLKIFAENKINKDNAWSMSLIDNFSALISKHHKSTSNFQMIGSTLEASSKIYGLRVDSVHTDVIHIATGLTRLKNKPQNVNGDGDGEMGENDGGSDDLNTSKPNGTSATPVKKPPKRRKIISTITKNKDSINLKFETNSVPEPTFAKLNSTIGDINSSQRLLTYILPTVNSELIHRTDLPFWDSEEVKPIEQNVVDPTKDYEFHEMKSFDVPICLNITQDNILRPQQSGYHISDAPAEEEPAEEQPIIEDYDVDMAFDMNAEIEPIESGKICYDTGFDGDEYDQLNDDDVQAIERCKGLQREHTIINDMRPTSSVNLEYSYRPLENIDRFWAGPSYWKFRRTTSTRTTAGGNTIAGQTIEKVPMRTGGGGRRTLNKKLEPVQFVDDFDDSMFVRINSKEASKMKKINISKRWDPKKLKLPTNHNLDRLMFHHYQFAPNLPMNWNNLADSDDDEQNVNNDGGDKVLNKSKTSDTKNEDNMSMDGVGDDHFGDVADSNDFDDGLNNDDGAMNKENDQTGINTQDNHAANETVQEIGTEFVGAPEKVQKIDILFARRAKVIDMKQLKRCCLAIVNKQRDTTKVISSAIPATTHQTLEDEDYEDGVATFNKIYNTLPTILTQNMQEALSPAIAFYSILHLSNEHQLRLQLVDGQDDFSIRKIVTNEETSPEQIVSL